MYSWDSRLKRAETLIESYSFAQNPLSFYREVLRFQKGFYTSLSQEAGSGVYEDRSDPFQADSINLKSSLLATSFPSFLSLIKRVGSQELSQVADRFLTASGQDEWEKLLESYWAGNLDPQDFQEGPVLLFFPKAFLQPYAELLADKHPQESPKDGEEWKVAQGSEAGCPHCGRVPQFGILRTEGEGASRSLLCCLCATEWRYKRVYCPSCGQEDFSKLSDHRASDFPHVRVEACEQCGIYMKSIDLTVDGRAVPVVDEVATLPLDAWAVEQGTAKSKST